MTYFGIIFQGELIITDGTAVSKMSPLRPFIWSFPAGPVAERSQCCCYYINYENINKTFVYPAHIVNTKDTGLFYVFSWAELVEVGVLYRVKSSKENHQMSEVKLGTSGLGLER